MRHKFRLTIEMIALALLALLWPAGDADAQFNGALRGEYDVSVQRTCTIGTGAQEPLHIALKGKATYNGAGGVTFTGQTFRPARSGTPGTGVTLPSGGGFVTLHAVQADITSCSGNYIVNPDGSFTEELNCSLTFSAISGEFAGQTATLNGVQIHGKLALDGTVLVVTNTDFGSSEVEELTIAGLPGPQHRICSSVGTATSRR